MGVIEVVGALLTPAVAAAINPLAIILVMLMLVTDRRATNAPAFTVGFSAGTAIVLVAVVALAEGVDAAADQEVRDGFDVIRLGLAAVFVALAVRTWIKRPRDGVDAEEPKYFAMVGELSMPKAFGVGVAIATILNPKNLAIEVGAGGAIGEAGLSIGGDVVVIAVFVLIAAITIVVPVVAVLSVGDRALPGLEVARTWLLAHHTAIMLVLFVVLAARYLGQGLLLFG